MSDNEGENPGDKRRSDLIEPDQPQKRQKIVNLQAFVPNNQDIIGTLTQLGQNLSLIADDSRVPETVISDNFIAIQQQLNDALQQSFDQAQLVRRQNEEQRVASEMEQMGEQERDQFQLLRNDFFTRFQPIAQRMSEQLTYGEQAQIFNIILNSIDTRLNENVFNNSEPNVTARLLELGTLTINFAIEQLAVTLSNLYQATPDLIRQLTSIIIAAGMAFNYLPSNLRGGFNSIPYFGTLFTLMNRINPQLRNIQNSGAVVTTIYYLLRNAGIDTTESIRLLGSNAAQLVTDCSIQVGRLVCQSASLASDAASSIMNSLADRLGNVLTREYQDISFRIESQESVSSVRSLSSQISVNTLQSQNSAKSMAIGQTIDQLVNTPIAEGGISLGEMDGQIVQQRLQAIMDENTAIIPDNIEEENFQIITQPPSVDIQTESYNRSQDSEVSGISNISEDTDNIHWSFWLFGPNNLGGKKLRKSRKRNYNKVKKRKTRKSVRKGKKLTKKRKNSRKTLKRKNKK